MVGRIDVVGRACVVGWARVIGWVCMIGSIAGVGGRDFEAVSCLSGRGLAAHQVLQLLLEAGWGQPAAERQARRNLSVLICQFLFLFVKTAK